MADPKPTTAAAKAPPANLPNLRDPSTAFYVERVRKAVKYQNGDTDEPIKINQICPVDGCGYPIVDRVRVGPGKYEPKPINHVAKFVRMCGWDPEHFLKEVDPLAGE
jgi:hypothetical protein